MAKEKSSFSYGGLFRNVLAVIFFVVASSLLTIYTVNRWFAPLYMDTDVWVETVAPLAKDPAVQQAVENYILTQTFARVDIETIITDALPERAAFLAVPLSNVIKDVSEKVVERVVTSPRFSEVWVAINRAVHSQLNDVISGEIDPSQPIQINMRSLVGQARDEGVKSILPRLADVSTQRLIVRLDLEKYIAPLQTLAMYSQRIARMGIVVVAFYLTGIALAKRRSYAFIGASTLTLLAALGLFTTVNFVIDEAQLLTSDPVVKNAVAAIATQLTATLVLYARQIALLSVFGILIGFLLSPLRIFRSLRRFLGFEWIQRKYRNTRMSRNMNTLRGMLYQYRAGIGFTTAIVLILVLMFAQGVDAVMVIRGISWWMILYSLITLASKPQEIK